MMKAVLALVLAMAAIACASTGVDVIRHTPGYDGFYGLYGYTPYYLDTERDLFRLMDLVSDLTTTWEDMV
ncbi:hypothetical protein HNY73_002564 [Argiope bruennichi]|uniref:Uncharacterized protein n=1 Tax=Argiope bruennichi TaxID=94029 RepID=A0A8T0FWE6_ARGBR|nr:hypothetical protein HNY73_002564 [Argiope bruennichi]